MTTVWRLSRHIVKVSGAAAVVNGGLGRGLADMTDLLNLDLLNYRHIFFSIQISFTSNVNVCESVCHQAYHFQFDSFTAVIIVYHFLLKTRPLFPWLATTLRLATRHYHHHHHRDTMPEPEVRQSHLLLFGQSHLFGQYHLFGQSPLFGQGGLCCSVLRLLRVWPSCNVFQVMEGPWCKSTRSMKQYLSIKQTYLRSSILGAIMTDCYCFSIDDGVHWTAWFDRPQSCAKALTNSLLRPWVDIFDLRIGQFSLEAGAAMAPEPIQPCLLPMFV